MTGCRLRFRATTFLRGREHAGDRRSCFPATGLLPADDCDSRQGEETLFRGLFLTYAFGQSAAQFALVIVVQAVLYAFTHIAFGPSTVLSKAVLGIGLGVGAYFAGIVVAIM